MDSDTKAAIKFFGVLIASFVLAYFGSNDSIEFWAIFMGSLVGIVGLYDYIQEKLKKKRAWREAYDNATPEMKEQMLNEKRAEKERVDNSFLSFIRLGGLLKSRPFDFEEIKKDYHENSVTAYDKYKSSIVMVRGVVASIYETFNTNVNIKSMVFIVKVVPIDGAGPVVCCNFSLDKKYMISQLKVGTNVEIKGKCDVSPDPSLDFFDCELLSPVSFLTALRNGTEKIFDS